MLRAMYSSDLSWRIFWMDNILQPKLMDNIPPNATQEIHVHTPRPPLPLPFYNFSSTHRVHYQQRSHDNIWCIQWGVQTVLAVARSWKFLAVTTTRGQWTRIASIWRTMNTAEYGRHTFAPQSPFPAIALWYPRPGFTSRGAHPQAVKIWEDISENFELRAEASTQPFRSF